MWIGENTCLSPLSPSGGLLLQNIIGTEALCLKSSLVIRKLRWRRFIEVGAVYPPLPPNRACGSLAHGSKVDSFFIEIGTLIIGLPAGSEKSGFREVGIRPLAVGSLLLDLIHLSCFDAAIRRVVVGV
uniref:Uncharacterized protein n=1 Tax=Candidatus Kentrum sp. MB TaxID=2138164 RepID=A0A450XRU9_9GAMM|nr:MAG: hypothetical protein BECKMB1821G_GA0114241_110010 [Candidatus Kentron sp. MB]VFK35035.1 MAG: hypothetical protein BECKMB1821I_GA0114274_109610 [Candidatus Kentron sp. MB]VFK77125.1 MAG: hypothetical protein BECKMB1821H_GA0114242_110110 [Candidatus Kentron sp. MB]